MAAGERACRGARASDTFDSTEQADGAALAPPQTPVLAAAKLATPRPRSGIVRRPRISEALDAAPAARLTVIAAPAGYGKTTAVHAWSAQSGTALAWVTLDAGDNDPVRLWTYIATAVSGVRDDLGRRALRRLRGVAVSIEAAIDELLDGIEAFGSELALVLDDAHTVTSADALASLEYLLERLPRSARLLLITRADPNIGLERLRARGELRELRARELQFTPSEAQVLLVDQAGIELDEADLAALLRRTEGWPAALQLAALWLRQVDDQPRAVREFGGQHRYVVEYLANEVLAALDPPTRSFLTELAVLGSFTAELCDGALDRADSVDRIAALERAQLFILPLERREWFRVHPLFAEFACVRLASTDPDAAARIHCRAAHWLRTRGLVVEAMDHAVAAGDHELLAELLSEHHRALIGSGRAQALVRSVRMLPDSSIVAHPELAGAAAMATTLVGGHAIERRRFLGLASRARIEYPERFTAYAESLALAAAVAGIDHGVLAAVAAGRTAVALAERQVRSALPTAFAGLIRALYLAGEIGEAVATGTRALSAPAAQRQSLESALIHSTLAIIAAERGRPETARTHVEQARACIGRLASSRSWLGATTAEALGAVLVAEGDLIGAERELCLAQRLLRDEVATVDHAQVLISLAAVRCARGRLDGADQALRGAREQLEELADAGSLTLRAVGVEHAIAQARASAGEGRLLQAPSPAELTVLRLLATELSASQIAARLVVSSNTVRSHTRALYRKLGVRSRADAVARGRALGLLDDGPAGDRPAASEAA